MHVLVQFLLVLINMHGENNIKYIRFISCQGVSALFFYEKTHHEIQSHLISTDSGIREGDHPVMLC
jgi:hypothetical protein